MCSSAIPVVFPYQNFMDKTFVDGGFTMNMDPFTPIKRCLDEGFDTSEIIVDMWFLNKDNTGIAIDDVENMFEAYFRG